MKILTYKYEDRIPDGWNFSKVAFGKINLLVGYTGSGKTRFLNTIFNIGSGIANPKIDLNPGHWEIDAKIHNIIYSWLIDVDKSESSVTVTKEKLIQRINDIATTIIDRDKNKFLFNDSKLPRLPRDKSAITILKDEDLIKPIYKGFSSILRRHFSMDALLRVLDYGSLNDNFFAQNKKLSIEQIFLGEYPLNVNLFLLKKYYQKYFEEICNYFKSVFPFVQNIEIFDLRELNSTISVPGFVPVVRIQEKENPKWIELRELSSGMQKVLLVITDFYILPDEGIYLLDEYENSLGTNAIDFLPTFLNEQETNCQFIITSHHPYLISNIPTKNWYIFHRERQDVSIMYGNQVVNKYGKSKQDSFIQLINDPYFNEGVK